MKDKHIAEAQNWFRSGDFTRSEGGLLIHGSILWRGVYHHSVNGEDERYDTNLVTTEGINYLLDAGLSGATPVTSWFLAPYGDAYAPVAGLTHATFDAQANELEGTAPGITTEGYTEALRQPWNEVGPSAGVIGNLADRAQFTIVTAATLPINGAGLLSSSTKNDTAAGVLISATQFGSTRTLNNGDVFELGYTVTLSDT